VLAIQEAAGDIRVSWISIVAIGFFVGGIGGGGGVHYIYVPSALSALSTAWGGEGERDQSAPHGSKYDYVSPVATYTSDISYIDIAYCMWYVVLRALHVLHVYNIFDI
jgi:hypothetical protein